MDWTGNEQTARRRPCLLDESGFLRSPIGHSISSFDDLFEPPSIWLRLWSWSMRVLGSPIEFLIFLKRSFKAWVTT